MNRISFVRRESGWLSNNFEQAQFEADEMPGIEEIDKRARLTAKTGKHPLWEGYAAVEDYRNARSSERGFNQVRTARDIGAFYTWLVKTRKARNVLEFGTAFGQSGMFWLTGLKDTGGHLYTFEPNNVWAELARANLAAISSQFTLTLGTFEDNAEDVMRGVSVDIAFIDAIHTGNFVRSQYAIVKRYMTPGGLVIFDDINFSADMQQCWQEISTDEQLVASAEIGRRCGIVELPAD